MAQVKVTIRGPLFVPGNVEKTLNEIANDTAGRLSTEGKRRVLSILDASLRNPTGAYRSRITEYGPVGGQSRVHDRQGIYGPWLNGTGSRNKTTSFKGYKHFTQTYQTLQQAAKAMANQVVSEHLWKLGG